MLAPLCGEKISPQTVSKITVKLNSEVEHYHGLFLGDNYQYLLLDGITMKVKSIVGVKKRLILCYLLFARTVAFAVAVQKKNVTGWAIKLALGDSQTLQFLLNKPKESYLRDDAVRLSILFLIIGLAISEFIYVVTYILRYHDVIKLVLEEFGFPLFYSLTIWLPYLVVRRHIKRVGIYRRETNQTEYS